MLSEQCGFGAAVSVRRHWQLESWRVTHIHFDREPEVMVPPVGVGAQVELSPMQVYEEDRIGFTPNRDKVIP